MGSDPQGKPSKFILYKPTRSIYTFPISSIPLILPLVPYSTVLDLLLPSFSITPSLSS
jgi:hypothetical protein